MGLTLRSTLPSGGRGDQFRAFALVQALRREGLAIAKRRMRAAPCNRTAQSISGENRKSASFLSFGLFLDSLFESVANIHLSVFMKTCDQSGIEMGSICSRRG